MPKTPAGSSPKSAPAKPSAAKTPARRRDVPQRDLFQLDSPLTGEIRGERSLMAFPFFALAKSAWMKPLSYHHGPVSIEVRPSANGVATIYDKEIVLFIASLMAAKIEAGEEVGQDFVFTAHVKASQDKSEDCQLKSPPDCNTRKSDLLWKLMLTCTCT
jgi:hypothetical protein